ncbi:MAG: hypothetical protein GY749_29965 [Desulfobacteraceae bacterium]|nr:hypothetical protein [Desulfobacteraceae bacterium]
MGNLSKPESEAHEDYNPIQAFESAAITFLNQNLYVSAACIFVNIVEINPENSMAWYGLANSLYCLAGKEGDLSILELSMSCVYRSLEEDNTNSMAAELSDWIINNTPLHPDVYSDCSPFNEDPKLILNQVGFTRECVANDFTRLESWQERMQIVMWLYDINEPYYADILIKALNDLHNDVKMAALKRIGPFGNQSEIRDKLENMLITEEFINIEPYFSIALGNIYRNADDSYEWVETLSQKLDEINRKYSEG